MTDPKKEGEGGPNPKIRTEPQKEDQTQNKRPNQTREIKPTKWNQGQPTRQKPEKEEIKAKTGNQQ